MTKINTNKQKIQELLERGTIVEILPKKEDFAKKFYKKIISSNIQYKLDNEFDDLNSHAAKVFNKYISSTNQTTPYNELFS